MIVIKTIFLILLTVFFNSCSKPGDEKNYVVGRFIDAPVSGVSYSCNGGNVFQTNEKGEYVCEVWEKVTFSIGDVEIGTVTAGGDYVTPYTIFECEKTSAINLARLLQSIDISDDPNSIVLSDSLVKLIPEGVEFNDDAFEKNIESALGIKLKSSISAQITMDDYLTLNNIPNKCNQNSESTADAGDDQNVKTESIVELDGSNSGDGDGDNLTYKWRFVSKPQSSGADLSNERVVNPEFTADVNGSYVVELQVSGGTQNSSVDSVTIIATADTTNSIPVADAGINQDVKTDNKVKLDGSNSSDADGDNLVYNWNIVSKPDGSLAELSNATIVNPSFMTDLDGSYIIELFVSDGVASSSVDRVVIISSTENSEPTAVAGGNQDVKTGDLVKLEGSNSFDPDGDNLTYIWRFISKPENSSVALSGEATVNPEFIANEDGSYVVELLVSDAKGNSSTDRVTITATTSVENSEPVANAGTNQEVKIGEIVRLDGSNSLDADGDNLTYRWSFITNPGNSFIELTDSTTVNPSFPAEIDGSYVVELIVNDGKEDSSPHRVTITATSSTENSAPVANVMTDTSAGNVKTESVIVLNGSESSDADADELSFFWQIVSRPSGSIATFVDNTAVSPEFTADVDGNYVVQLVVNDGSQNSSMDNITITAVANTENSVPVADAGAGQDVKVGDNVTLDGSNSSDADGDNLTYQWDFASRPNGSLTQLQDAQTVNPSFTADVDGSYIVKLVVSDSNAESNVDRVAIKVTGAAVNSVPVANAGTDQDVKVGDSVKLDGSRSSDADGDNLQYQWSFVIKPIGSEARLSDENAVTPDFKVDKDGDYVVKLIVSDGIDDSSADRVVIKATQSTKNSTPVANAGTDQDIKTGDSVKLDGSNSSDADGDNLTYKWSFSSKPNGSGAGLSGEGTVNPEFKTDIDGDYVIKLIVSDGVAQSSADSVTIKATSSTTNSAPIANAGADQDVKTGSVVTLDGSKSSDADGDSLKYSWSISSKPLRSSVQLSDENAVRPEFKADVDGSYVIRLIVSDGNQESRADSVTIKASTVNSAPIANAGSDQDVQAGSVVTLDGSNSSDADKDSLKYSWSFSFKPKGSGAQLSDQNAVRPEFKADVEGSYVVKLIVNDGSVDSAEDRVTVKASTANSAPVANAGADQNVKTGDIVKLDGSKSSDADGDSLKYSWNISSRPTASEAKLTDASIQTPEFKADITGDYVIKLVVNDGNVDSSADSVNVRATENTKNATPVAEAGANQKVKTGDIVKLDGSKSSDADGDKLTYSWKITDRPLKSEAKLTDENAITPEFKADVRGDYVIELIVNDGTIDSAADKVVIQASIL